MKKFYYLIILFLVFIKSNSIFGQWSIDPYENNPITINDDDQRSPVMINDGKINFIVAYNGTLSFSSGLYIFVQFHLDVDGGYDKSLSCQKHWLFGQSLFRFFPSR